LINLHWHTAENEKRMCIETKEKHNFNRNINILLMYSVHQLYLYMIFTIIHITKKVLLDIIINRDLKRSNKDSVYII